MSEDIAVIFFSMTKMIAYTSRGSHEKRWQAALLQVRDGSGVIQAVMFKGDVDEDDTILTVSKYVVRRHNGTQQFLMQYEAELFVEYADKLMQ